MGKPIDIIAVKVAVQKGELAVRVQGDGILLGCPKSGEWVKIGELPESLREAGKR